MYRCRRRLFLDYLISGGCRNAVEEFLEVVPHRCHSGEHNALELHFCPTETSSCVFGVRIIPRVERCVHFFFFGEYVPFSRLFFFFFFFFLKSSLVYLEMDGLTRPSLDEEPFDIVGLYRPFFPQAWLYAITVFGSHKIPPILYWEYLGSVTALKSGSDSRERAYDHSPYGHHERSGSFERPRHYNTEYYRDRTMFPSGVSSSPAASTISSGFDAPESHFESRIRDSFTISSSTRRDPYRDDRGRRTDRTYHHRRSRSSHSSQSRHPSPQRSAGQTPKAAHSPKRAPVSPGRGPRSHSRSPSSSSDSVSSTSSTGSGSDSNSSSSEGSRARSVQSTATHAPPAPHALALDSDEPRRSFGIRVQNLPTRSTDTSLKDGLFHEFKKYGKVTSVQIHGELEERYGLVFFRQQEDQEKALGVSKGKLFFGMLIEVTAWNGPETESENEFRPLDGRIDEFHPKATRTLFIGNLEKTANYQQLLDVFQRFGEIVDIDIKRVNGVPQYAFVQYSDIASVCKAIKKMDGEYLGTNRLKLGFGKSMPTACVWLDGLTSNITEQYLTRHFCRYGPVVKVVFDRLKGMALILFNNTDFAQAAVRETKGWKIGGNKIKVDFASQESQMAFYRSMQASGQDIRDFYDIPSDRREDRRTSYDFSAERAYYENVRTPGIYAEDPRRDYPTRSRERYAELDHYQGEHYDPRYHEDPREYRDYRDPFEDIRKYSYIQRERERERFEAERGRWSPSHQRRPLTPSASPSPSDRVSRDAERRVYRHSSERSGSCSSLSPTPAHLEKSEKLGVDYKSEGLEREMEQAEAERLSGAENKKRSRRKEKADREKAKQRRGKVQSPGVPLSEADREAILDLGSGKVKVSDVESQERQKHKGDKEPSPTDHVARLESQKGERLDQCKSESLDRDGKRKAKKHLKSDSGSDGKDSLLDSDKLEARKRRFGDPGGKAIRQKRGRLEEDPGSGISQPAEFAPSAGFAKETDIDVKAEKEAKTREHSKSRIGSHYSQREEVDDAMRGTSQGSSVRSGELPEVDVLDSKSHPGPSMSRRLSTDGTSDKDNKVRDEYLENIDLSQSYRKQMEQKRRLRQQLQPLDIPGKSEPPQGVDAEDLEHRSLVHEVGKPPQDVTDNSPPSKIKKQESFEMDMNAKRERIYRTVRQKSEDLEWNNTNSPRFQHAPQQREEEYADPHDQMTMRVVKEPLKPEDNILSDQELGGKRMHTSQMSKMSTCLQDDQQRCWESRLKQDLLPDFSRIAEKRRLHRKYLDYGLWPDLEPGEVRSDSEEDRENKSNSPAPSTSVSFSERHRPNRLSESKLMASLERNKFCSFADDQTITPDTKALLERAKSLSSTREDNWSFLDYDQHFPSFSSRKDTEKVESTPRPTPSWYMKKKKIRSESDDKIDDRKEDPKPEEQERRELFASRFLHSSIFEQDSRRLQHLERKHEDPEHGVGYLYSQQGPGEGQPDPEPVVLFHSRFLELTRLQQQKNKEQSHQDSKQDESIDATKVSKTPEEEQAPQQQNATEHSIKQAEIKSVSPVQVPQTSPVQAPQISPPVSAAEESLPTVEAEIDDSVTRNLLDSNMKAKDKEHEQPTVYPLQPLLEQLSEPNSSEIQESKILTLKADDSESAHDTSKVVAEQLPSNETPNNNVQPEAEPPVMFPESPSPLSHIPAEQHEKEPEPPVAAEAISINADDQECADNYTVEEVVSSPPKSRNKRAKSSPTTPVTTTFPVTPDKQSTRKSERIDKEKLKRSSSPRGEAFKTTPDSKSLSKSPVHSIEMEQGAEQSSQSGRARRRNVRSVYATPIEDETGLQPGKDAESPRGGRKRGVDRDLGSEVEAVAAPPTLRRGRPPKNRRQAEDVPAVKVERSKSTDSKELGGSETSSEGVPKVGKGKFSSPTQKGVSPGNASASGIGKKGDKMEKISESTKLINEENPPILKNLRIRLDVTEVKAMLQTSEEEPGIDGSPKNSSPGVSSKDEVLEVKFENDAIDDVSCERETLPAVTNAIEPHVASLTRELELEQAVENIAKLTEDAPSLPFKSNLTKAQRLAAEKPEHVSEEEKPANPSSETELAAAIDSIKSEDMDQIMNSVVESGPDIQTLGPGSKESETCVSTAVVQEETVTTPRKGCKGRSKTSRKGKGQKAAGSKKEPIKDVVLKAQNIPVKSMESVPAELPAVTERSPASSAVVITSSSKQRVSLMDPNADIPNEPVSPLKTEMDISKSSPAISRSPTSSKCQPSSYKNTCPSLSPTRTCLKNLSSYPSRISVSPTECFNQPKEAGLHSPPLTSVAPMETPTLPSDTPAQDANSGDLRKILTKPRTVPVLEIGATSGKIHAHPLRESDITSAVVTSKSAPQDNRQLPFSAQPVVRQPASIPSPETKQIFSEKSVISVIASTPTSVISRVCNPPDAEEKSNAQIGNPFLDKQPPKQIYQPSLEESSTYHGPAVGEEGGNAGRYIVESTSLSTGSSTGLRVQTSEGVVVLSHSGQKMEGPLRISAKISQIPPASAVDIESQQLVSVPQIKQELYSASQPPSSKCPLPSDHGNSIKSQPNVATIKQESALDKLESAYTPVQSGVVKILQQTPGPSQVMSYVEKPAWVPTISPAISPHLPSAAGNHVGFIAGTPTDRTSLIQPKQEPRSPRKSGHPHSPFAKVSSPIGSSSPKAVSVVLPPGLNPLSQYVSTVHHSEQSVIMPPHNPHGSIGRMSPHRVGAIGHLTQGEVRVNTPPLSMMNYGIHSESLTSSWAPGQQRPTSPQTMGNREMVLKVNPANARSPAAQLKQDSIPAEYRGALHSGLPLDRFNRDMRVLMHHQQSDRPTAELHQGHVPENIPPSSTATSMAASLSPRPHLLAKAISERDSSKASELRRAQSPSSKEGMMAIRSAMPPMASPQRVQLITAGTGASFPEYSTMYTNLRPAHTQFAENSPMGINQSAHSIPPSQGVQEPESSQEQAESKVELVGHQPVNMVQLLTKYPIVWQGLLALKNDTAAVQLHFLCGNKALGLRSLPLPETGGILRIVQRMRLEAQQLEGVARRMTGESDFCLLLAMPCGLDQEDVLNQTQALKSAFIHYLQAKLAAGIINVPNPGSNQPAYVLQIFPPCEFSESHLSRLAPDLLSQISSISPHLMIVITSV
ncbi:msx2-interacting protein isoform X2 [Carassius carassius]|uniref:msx2-interacting protein isoform X2 n=1 Tax=Carassius carassius TaxID=217509 RepID=UPI0028686A4D|nr:msx2-interacting protein isoform X2 [Carassius carassius]